jgi:hypothetical protein
MTSANSFTLFLFFQLLMIKIKRLLIKINCRVNYFTLFFILVFSIFVDKDKVLFDKDYYYFYFFSAFVDKDKVRYKFIYLFLIKIN